LQLQESTQAKRIVEAEAILTAKAQMRDKLKLELIERKEFYNKIVAEQDA
jgi:hypothetical protein